LFALFTYDTFALSFKRVDVLLTENLPNFVGDGLINARKAILVGVNLAIWY